MKERIKKLLCSHLLDYSFCFLVVTLIVLCLYIKKGYTPFGIRSLATLDANIQYLDFFFAYLKDVLNGKNSIYYTFGKSLGGNNISVFSYYLCSPLNLLVLLFDKSQLHIFFNLLVLIKLGLAAVSMRIFLRYRFIFEGDCFETRLINCLLSICYGLCQYAISQSNNIIWLDGMIMLPIILLGVYENNNNKNFFLLSISVGLSIIFNWYTDGINCVFSIIWFAVEYYLYCKGKHSFKYLVQKLYSYGVAMLLGVGLSAFIFSANSICAGI